MQSVVYALVKYLITQTYICICLCMQKFVYIRVCVCVQYTWSYTCQLAVQSGMQLALNLHKCMLLKMPKWLLLHCNPGLQLNSHFGGDETRQLPIAAAMVGGWVGQSADMVCVRWCCMRGRKRGRSVQCPSNVVHAIVAFRLQLNNLNDDAHLCK